MMHHVTTLWNTVNSVNFRKLCIMLWKHCLINCVHPSLSDNNIHEKLIIFIIKRVKLCNPFTSQLHNLDNTQIPHHKSARVKTFHKSARVKMPH